MFAVNLMSIAIPPKARIYDQLLDFKKTIPNMEIVLRIAAFSVIIIST